MSKVKPFDAGEGALRGNPPNLGLGGRFRSLLDHKAKSVKNWTEFRTTLEARIAEGKESNGQEAV